MRLKPSSNITIFVVLLVVVGLVLAYVPLLFQPKTNYPDGLGGRPPAGAPPEQQSAASLVLPETTAASSSENQSKNLPSPDGFSGLEEENKSLEGLLNQKP